MSAGRFDTAALAEPIVQAPMGGGTSTPALAAAVSAAGGLGFLAAAYRPVDGLREDIATVRAATDAPFGVNLFFPQPDEPDADALARYVERLGVEAERYGASLGEARYGDDDYDAKLALARDERVPVVSFTMGCPDRAVVEELQAAGAAVWITVTTVAEAVRAHEVGADALTVQGVEAGGHRGSFEDVEPGDVGLLALLQLVAAEVDLPMVAAGGIATGRGVAAVLAAGAVAAQVGTAFMLTPEAGTPEPQRRALATDAPTALTRAFSGRTARGIANRFLREHEPVAPRAFPYVHHLTVPLRAAAKSQGDPEAMSLWAGQAHALAPALPAAEVVRTLGREGRQALQEAAGRFGSPPGR